MDDRGFDVASLGHRAGQPLGCEPDGLKSQSVGIRVRRRGCEGLDGVGEHIHSTGCSGARRKSCGQERIEDDGAGLNLGVAEGQLSVVLATRDQATAIRL